MDWLSAARGFTCAKEEITAVGGMKPSRCTSDGVVACSVGRLVGQHYWPPLLVSLLPFFVPQNFARCIHGLHLAKSTLSALNEGI